MRKRTKMVDQRLSRSRISVGADPQQLLAAQHAAQHGPPSRAASPSPRVVETQDKPQSPPVPPLPPVMLASEPHEPEAPAAPVSVPQDSYVPPPRPTFAEPEPSAGDYISPPRPTFLESENATDDGGIVISPPTPIGTTSPVSPVHPGSMTPPAGKVDDEKVLTSQSSLSRSGSGEAASRVRGPRTARSTAKVGSAAAPPVKSSSPPGSRPTHTRGQSSVSPDRAKEYAPKKHVGKANAAIFSRRTQASDAEDNVLDK